MAERAVVVTDMDGTLTTADTWRGVLAWVKAHYPSRAADTFVRSRLHLVAIAKLGLGSKEAFRAAWFHDLSLLLTGMTEEQAADMCEYVVDAWLWPARREAGLTAVLAAFERARAADPTAELVLATGAFQGVADAFARRAGAQLAFGTPLEVQDGRLTGKIAGKVGSGAQKAAAIRVHAADRTIVAAFGDTAADIPMLQMAQRAVAIAPDRQLRRAAVAAGWEILEGEPA